MITDILAVAWRPAAVIIVAGLLTFFPDYLQGQPLERSLVDGGWTSAKVAGALLGIDRAVVPAVRFVQASRAARASKPPSPAP